MEDVRFPEYMGPPRKEPYDVDYRTTEGEVENMTVHLPASEKDPFNAVQQRHPEKEIIEVELA